MKRGFSVLLVSCLILAMLAGCGGKAGKGGQAGALPGAKDGAAASEKLSFSISFSTGGNIYIESSPDINNDKWVLKLEEMTNTDLDIRLMSHKEFDQKMSLMFAGNDIPDVVGNMRGGPTTASMSGSVEAGVFMPLDDLLKEHAPNLMKMVTPEAWEEVSYNGRIYGIPAWLENPSRRATFIRTDLMEKAGIKEAPKTVEEYLDMLRAFKKLGVEHPYQYRENFKYADTFLGAFDVLPFQFMELNGEVVPKFFDVENMTKALQTYKTMYDEGLIPKDFASLSQVDYRRNINSGKSGMWASNGEGLIGFRTKLKEVDPSMKVDIYPSPTGPDGKGGLGLYSSISTTYYINDKVGKEKAIEIIKFLDWMLTEEADMFFSFGIEGENYTIENGKVNYKWPVKKEEVDEAGFRANQLWFVHELTYNKKQTALTEDGQDVVAAFRDVLSKEGRGGITFTANLNSFSKFPDLASTGDTGPKFILDSMVKMIYGKQPISDWPKVLEEYRAKGGDEIIKEATERWMNKENVVDRTR
ncbi:extracellular solute-binding protein [Paenibacillus lactis]|uniref:extracellular solute-binding protein n=1 Tax=Paenibacillus lactis TaxID=228574 RepID=UPI00119E9861